MGIPIKAIYDQARYAFYCGRKNVVYTRLGPVIETNKNDQLGCYLHGTILTVLRELERSKA